MMKRNALATLALAAILAGFTAPAAAAPNVASWGVVGGFLRIDRSVVYVDAHTGRKVYDGTSTTRIVLKRSLRTPVGFLVLAPGKVGGVSAPATVSATWRETEAETICSGSRAIPELPVLPITVTVVSRALVRAEWGLPAVGLGMDACGSYGNFDAPTDTSTHSLRFFSKRNVTLTVKGTRSLSEGGATETINWTGSITLRRIDVGHGGR